MHCTECSLVINVFHYVCDTSDADDGGERRQAEFRDDEMLRRCVVSERRPSTTASDPSPTKLYLCQSRHPNHDDRSPRLNAAPVISGGDTSDVKPRKPARHSNRVDDTPGVISTDPSLPTSRTPRPRPSTTSPLPVDGGAPRQQPQPIMSIHFDSEEIDSTLPGNGANDDGVTLGLDTDRCTFETTFPVRDRRQATRARLPALSDDHVDDDQDLRRKRLDFDEEQQPGEGLRRWRTLEDVHQSSMDSLIVPEDDGRGDAEDLSTPPKHKQNSSPKPGLHPRRVKRRSTSAPSRSFVGFYVDSDWDSTDDSQDDANEEYQRRRRDDGAGDRRSIGTGAELLELEVGSEDWMEMQRDIYRTQSRAEQMSNPPSPRTRILLSANTVPSPIDHQQVLILTPATKTARTVVTTRQNNVPQQRHQMAVPATNSTVGQIKPDQVTISLLGFNIEIQRLLLALSIILLLAGIVYKYASPSTAGKPEQLTATESPQWKLDELVSTYLTDIFD